MNMGNLYYKVIDVTNFGPYVTRHVLGMPRDVAAEELQPEMFSAFIDVKDKDGQLMYTN